MAISSNIYNGEAWILYSDCVRVLLKPVYQSLERNTYRHCPTCQRIRKNSNLEYQVKHIQ